ncbi:hypothetical protein GW881_00555 [Candidatus Roizmanbacteria bacterium]|nr:hypothetical protein [Candidatus Roizmanbacteria bacterium]
MKKIRNYFYAVIVICFFGIMLFLFIPTNKTPSQPAVVQQIKELNRLETITYSMEKI